MNKQKIKDFVYRVTKTYETRDPYTLACRMGIELIWEPLGSIYGYFSDFAGFKLIHLNSDTPAPLRTFICAHELGHFLLHSGLGVHAMGPGTFLQTCGMEREANQFAVELLLPDSLLQENPDTCVNDLTRAYGVPEEAVPLK